MNKSDKEIDFSDNIEINFQPIYEVVEGTKNKVFKIVKFETLSNIKKGSGYEKLGDFFKALEKNGQTLELFRYIFYELIKVIPEFKERFIDNISFSINSYPDDIADDRFFSYLQNILNNTYIHPNNITIEVLESKLNLNNKKSFHSNLDKIEKNGFGIAIDDYGSGSSIKRRVCKIIKINGLDYLKIDCSKIKGIVNKTDTGIINYIKEKQKENIDLEIIFEGVEQKEQADKIIEIFGINKILFQGHYFSEKLDKESALELEKTIEK